MVQPGNIGERETGEDVVVREYRNLRRIHVLCKDCDQIIGYYGEFRPHDEVMMKVYFGALELESHFKLASRLFRCRCDTLLGLIAEDNIHLYIFKNIMKITH